MHTRHPTERTTLRQCLYAEAEEALTTADSNEMGVGRALAALALLGAATLLVIAPAFVAAVSMLNGHALDGAQAWIGWGATDGKYLGLELLALVIVVPLVVSSAPEEQ